MKTRIDAGQQLLLKEKKARAAAEKALEKQSQELQRLQKELDCLKQNFEKEVDRQTADIKSVALFAVQYPEPLIRINYAGEVIAKNVSATFLNTFEFNESIYPESKFWKLIASFVKRRKSDWQLEVMSGGKLYTFLCSPHPKNDYINIYGKDITQERKVFKEMQRLSLVASANANGVIFLGADGRINWANEGFSRLTDYTNAETIGKTHEELCQGPLTSKDTLLQMKNLLFEGRPFSVELIHYRKDGSRFWGRCNGQPILDEKGAVMEYFTVVEDITLEKEQEQKLRKREEKYRSIVANAHLGLAETDLQGRVRFANQRFCDMCGYEPVELLGQVISDLLFCQEYQKIEQEQMKKRWKGISGSYEVSVRTKSGEANWWLISGAPLYSDEGKIIGSIAVFLDITEQKILEQKLREANKEAAHLVQVKEMFMANMSHEIRTPMNAVLGMAQLLQKTSLNEEQSYYLKAIHNAAGNLLVIINDILDFSKINAGKIALETIGFDLKKLMQQAVFTMGYKAEEKGLALSVSVDERLNPVLLGDPFRLNQILMNLLSNAIKFTEKGGVQLICRVQKETAEQQTLLLQVKDTGIGMEEGYLNFLFEKFTQEDENVARRYGGTGLGMSISKQLVEMMHGSIDVDSTKYKGTTVTLLLTFSTGTENDLPKKEEKAVNTRLLQHKKILVAEDNQMNRMLVNAILQHYGVSVTEAVNGLEAIGKLRSDDFDLVLMDVQMPEMDGLEATRQIRDRVDKNIPIIALTANAIDGELDKCLRAGMNGYLSKPFEEEDLLHLITKWLSKDAGFMLPPEEQETGQPLYDLSRLKAISRGNTDFIHKMLSVFVKEVPDSVRSIREAFRQQDFGKVKALAHRIKPSIDNMGISLLKEDIRNIEKLAAAAEETGELDLLIRKLENIIGKVVQQIEYSQAALESMAG